MAVELDTPPPMDTFRRFVWNTAVGLAYLRAHWGRRLVGGAIGLIADALNEGATQAFYARLPGHSQQAPDSLSQVGRDRDLFRFRGETDANWKARVRDAWTDYEQAGSPQQMLHVINQWGAAGWPATWDPADLTLIESGNPAEFTFNLSIAFGSIDPPWSPEIYGTGHVYGESGFFYGLSSETDIAMLRYLVRKWKPSRSQGTITIHYSLTDSVTLVV